jgi:hypothetical protein
MPGPCPMPQVPEFPEPPPAPAPHPPGGPCLGCIPSRTED